MALFWDVSFNNHLGRKAKKRIKRVLGFAETAFSWRHQLDTIIKFKIVQLEFNPNLNLFPRVEDL